MITLLPTHTGHFVGLVPSPPPPLDEPPVPLPAVLPGPPIPEANRQKPGLARIVPTAAAPANWRTALTFVRPLTATFRATAAAAAAGEEAVDVAEEDQEEDGVTRRATPTAEVHHRIAMFLSGGT